MAWLVFGILGLLLTAGLIWNGLRVRRKAELIDRAVPATSVTIERCLPGELVSISGTARCDQTLTSQHQSTPCVYYESSIIREYQKQRASRRGGRSRGKETVHTDTRSVPFRVEDRSGRVAVLPDGADFDADETLNEYVPETDQSGVIQIAGVNVTVGYQERTLGHRYIEKTIPVDEPVFVLGVVDERGDIGAPDGDRDNAGLIISYRDADSLQAAWEGSASRQLYGSVLVFLIAVSLLGYWMIEHGPL